MESGRRSRSLESGCARQEVITTVLTVLAVVALFAGSLALLAIMASYGRRGRERRALLPGGFLEPSAADPWEKTDGGDVREDGPEDGPTTASDPDPASSSSGDDINPPAIKTAPTESVGGRVRRLRSRVKGMTSNARRPTPPGLRGAARARTIRRRVAPMPWARIVCRRRGDAWWLGVEVSGSAGRHSVQQGGHRLQPDPSTRMYPLRDFIEPVTVTTSLGSRSRRLLTAGGGPWMLFKLRLGGRRGQRVTYPSDGLYVVFVPESWKWAGMCPCIGRGRVIGFPEVVGYEFVHDLGRWPIGPELVDDMGRRVTLTMPWLHVELVGNRIRLPGDRGDLFGPEPPKLRASLEAWSQVGQLVLVDEEPHGERLRHTWLPPIGEEEQALPLTVASARCGWFTVRVYDLQDSLLQSLDFRFVGGLRSAQLETGPTWPDAEGHREAHLVLRGPEDLRIRVAPSAAAGKFIEVGGTECDVVIPAEESFDRLRGTISLGRRHVRIQVELSRIWWGIAEGGGKPTTWTDRCIDVDRARFAAGSRASLVVKLPDVSSAESLVVMLAGTPKRWQLRPDHHGVASLALRAVSSDPSWRNDSDVDVCAVSSDGTVNVRLLHCAAARYTCWKCEFLSHSQEEVFEHAWVEHTGDLYRKLGYNEVQEKDDALPRAITQCPYCDQMFVDDDDGTAAREHVRECPRVPRNLEGRVPPRFRIARDQDDIRARLLPGLPWWLQCQLCQADFRGADAREAEEAVKHHLGRVHIDEICPMA